MNNTVLQVPLSSDLREKAEKAAENMGFSSLQEAVRIFLKKLSDKEISLSLGPVDPKNLSRLDEKRYLEMAQDYNKIKSKFDLLSALVK